MSQDVEGESMSSDENDCNRKHGPETRKPVLDPSRQLKTVEQGAVTQVWCAPSPQLNGLGGVFCENVEVARFVPQEERSGWSSDDSSRKVGGHSSSRLRTSGDPSVRQDRQLDLALRMRRP